MWSRSFARGFHVVSSSVRQARIFSPGPLGLTWLVKLFDSYPTCTCLQPQHNGVLCGHVFALCFFMHCNISALLPCQFLSAMY